MIALQRKDMVQPVAKGQIASQRRELIHQKVTFLSFLREDVSENVDVVFILHQCEYQPT